MRQRKGILLTGRVGNGLYPVTTGIPGTLVPVYDKPLVYYALSCLIDAGVEQVALVATAAEAPVFRRLLGDGSALGLSIDYLAAPAAHEPAAALALAARFLDGAPSLVAAGSQLLNGAGLDRLLSVAGRQLLGAHLFACPLRERSRHLAVETGADGRATALGATGALAASGLCFFDGEAPARARRAAAMADPAAALLRSYLDDGALRVTRLSRGFAWFETDTPDELMAAAEFVQTLECRQGIRIGSPEEAAYRRGLIDAEQLMRLARPLIKSGYGAYLQQLAEAGLPGPAAAGFRRTA